MGQVDDRVLTLRAGERALAFDGRPRLMGILNATPDSFSGDSAQLPTLEARLARAHELVAQGAAVIDVGADVAGFLRERMALAVDRGVSPEQLVVDPGPDFAKSPAQTVEALRALPALRELGRPILLAVSRKDFVGALTGRRPAERDAGTLAALAFGVDAGADLLRVHDVAAAADFLAVRAALRGDAPVDPGLRLADGLRREPEG